MTSLAHIPNYLLGILFAIGRIGLASLFLLGGLNKIMGFEATAERMMEVGLAPVALLLPTTIGLELIGGAFVAIGRWGSGPAALVLCVFTLATNFFFHAFWTIEGSTRAVELSLFFKNLSIAGALLMVAAISDWRPFIPSETANP